MSMELIKKYKLPRALHYQCIWLVKDMDRLESIVARAGCAEECSEDEIIIYVDDMDRVLSEKIVAEANHKLNCITRAIELVPKEYREGIIANIKDMESLGDTAHDNTWKYWKQRFIYSLAKNLSLY